MAYNISDFSKDFLERNEKNLKGLLKEEKKQKYRNEGSWLDGFYFRSKKEAKYYSELKLLFRAKAIAGFSLQPKFILQEVNDGKGITYSADFIIYNNDGTYRVVDTKGYESKEWLRTYKMFKEKYPEIDLEVVK